MPRSCSRSRSARGRRLPRLSAALAVPSARRIVLEQLTEAQATQLLGELDPRAAATIYRAGGGNPFYLEQLSRAREEGTLAAALDADSMDAVVAGMPVPAAVAASLAEELASLPTMELGAAPGCSGRRRAVRARSGRGDRRATSDGRARRARRSSRARSRAPDTGATPFRLPSPARAARGLRGEHRPAGGSRPTPERLRALTARGAPPAERAHHVEQYASQGDEEAIALLLEAGTAAAPRAPAAAARWFEATLALLPASDEAPGGRARGPRLVAPLARRARPLSRDRCSRRSSCFPPDAVARRVELTAHCAAVEHWLGRHDEAHRRLTRAWEELPDRSTARSRRARDRARRRRALRTSTSSRRSRWVGRRSRRREPWATTALIALGRGGAVPRRDGRRRRSTSRRGHRQEAVAEIDRLSDAELAPRLEALYHLAWAETYLELYDDVDRPRRARNRDREGLRRGPAARAADARQELPLRDAGPPERRDRALRDGPRGGTALRQPARALPRPLRARLDAVLRRRPRRRDRGPRGELARRPEAGRSHDSRTAAAGRAGGSASRGSRQATSSVDARCCSSSSARTVRARCLSSAASTGRA